MSKSSDNLSSIFQEGNCLSNSALTAYVKGNLGGTDLHEAESHLIDCPLCSDAVEGLKAWDNESEFQNTLDKINSVETEKSKEVSENSETPVISFTQKYSKYLAAATITFAIAIGGILFLNPAKNMSDFQASYFGPELNLISETAGADKTAFFRGLEAFNNNEYESALSSLQVVTDEITDPFYMVALIYAAASYNALHKPNKALESLNPYFDLATFETPYYEDAAWQMAAAYLQIKAYTDFENIMINLSEMNKEKAREIPEVMEYFNALKADKKLY